MFHDNHQGSFPMRRGVDRNMLLHHKRWLMLTQHALTHNNTFNIVFEYGDALDFSTRVLIKCMNTPIIWQMYGSTCGPATNKWNTIYTTLSLELVGAPPPFWLYVRYIYCKFNISLREGWCIMRCNNVKRMHKALLLDIIKWSYLSVINNQVASLTELTIIISMNIMMEILLHCKYLTCLP